MEKELDRTGRNARYMEKCDSIILRPPIHVGVSVRNAAMLSGKSLQRYILDALREQMLKDGFPMGE